MATELTTLSHQIVSLDPATGEILAELDCAGEMEVLAAVEKARGAQPAWAAAGVEQRVRVLRRFQQLLRQKKSQVARLISREAGKPYVEALVMEILVVLDCVRFACQTAPELLRPQRVSHGLLAVKAKSGRILREPY